MVARWIRVLGSPRSAFAAHDPKEWGWLLPLVVVAGLTVVAGAAAVLSGAPEHQLEQVRQQLAAQGQSQAQQDQALKITGFFLYLGPLVFAPLLAVLWAASIAGACALLGLVLQPGGEPVPFRRALSVSSHASLAVALGAVALLAGTLSGNPGPATSLQHLASAGSLVSAIGSRIDPVVFLYYVVLAAGMQASLGFSRAVSWLLCGGLYAAGSLLAVAGAVASGMGKAA